MAFGFMANESVVAGIADFYDVTKPIKLVGTSVVDEYARVMPQACWLSQLDLLVTVTSGAPKCIKALLTWDAAGDDIMFRETEGERVVAGVTTGGRGQGSVPLGTFLRAPSSQTAEGEVYLWIKVDTGTFTLDVARLHWAATHGR